MLYAITLAMFWLAPGWGLAGTLDAPVEGAKKEAKLVLYTAMQPEELQRSSLTSSKAAIRLSMRPFSAPVARRS